MSHVAGALAVYASSQLAVVMGPNVPDVLRELADRTDGGRGCGGWPAGRPHPPGPRAHRAAAPAQRFRRRRARGALHAGARLTRPAPLPPGSRAGPAAGSGAADQVDDHGLAAGADGVVDPGPDVAGVFQARPAGLVERVGDAVRLDDAGAGAGE